MRVRQRRRFNTVAAAHKKAGVLPPFGLSRVRIDHQNRPAESNPPELPSEDVVFVQKAGNSNEKDNRKCGSLSLSLSLSLVLVSSAPMANDRAGVAVFGTLSAIGNAARTLVGSIAEPLFGRSRGSRRSSATQQAQRAAVAEPSSHVSDIPPAPRSQTDAPAAAPPTPTTSVAPPVQPLE